MRFLVIAIAIAVLLVPAAQVSAANNKPMVDATSVYSGDTVIGKDPDAGIRSQILRDFGHESEN